MYTIKCEEDIQIGLCSAVSCEVGGHRDGCPSLCLSLQVVISRGWAHTTHGSWCWSKAQW